MWRLLQALSKQTGATIICLPKSGRRGTRSGEQHCLSGRDKLAEVAWFDKSFAGAQPVGTT